jgi:ABC-2 type transport system permease protein
MHRLAFKNFIRSKTVIASLLVVLLTGFVSIFIGKQFLTRQEKAVKAVTYFQQEHIERNVQYFNKDMGLLMYYLRFAFINRPDKLAAISVGQRDVNPSIQAVTIRGLEAQKYDTDLNNPANLLSGNLDLGFVIIYLFPLLIISFTFNLLSEEKEGGTWPLVAVQSKSSLKFLLQKLGVRAAIVYALLAVLLGAAVAVLSIPFNASFLLLCAVAVLYVTFWFGLSFFIASLAKSSAFNALLLLAIWVTLTILLPASVNNYVAGKYPVPEALSTMVKQRDGYHQAWDKDRVETMNKFYAHYPQYKKYQLPDKSFNWLWYYAMQQLGDDESALDAALMKEKLSERERSSSSIAAFIPTMHTQLQFNAIAGSGMTNNLRFLDSTTAFHERLRLHFYPKIFEEAAVANENWKKFTPHYFSTGGEMSWRKALLPLLIAIALVWLAGVVNMKRVW